MDRFLKISRMVSAASALLILVMLVLGLRAEVGPLVTLMFVSLAIGVRGTSSLKGFSFTIWILAAVSTSMFYPQFFTEFRGYRLSRLITPLMQLIMFGMGTTMSARDFIGVVKMPKGVGVGLLCQFSIMPLVGFTLASTMGFPPEIAAGIVLIGSCPSGLASNVMAYIAGANLALSITMTTVATLAAPLMTPLLMKFLAGQMVPISFFGMMWNIIQVVIIPVFAGLMFNHIFRGRAKWLNRAMPMVSMFGIAYIITIITAAGRNDLLVIGPLLILAAVIHNLLGYFFGYWGSRFMRLDENSCRTIAIEVGLQNGGLASSLALGMDRLATTGLAPAIFGPWMNVSGSILANWFRGRPVEKPVAEPIMELEPEV